MVKGNLSPDETWGGAIFKQAVKEVMVYHVMHFYAHLESSPDIQFNIMGTFLWLLIQIFTYRAAQNFPKQIDSRPKWPFPLQQFP